MIRILVVDDHAIVRDGLRLLLGTQPDMQVVGEARDGIEALAKVRQLKPDVVVLDIAMPRMNGLEAVGLIREAVPEAQILMLSMYEKEAYAHQVLAAGARGYVLKGADSGELLAAVRTVYAGDFFLSRRVQASVIDRYLERVDDSRQNSHYDQLSDREKQVFMLLIEGNNSLQIGQVLCVSAKTVEKHRANIVKKLGTSSLVDMVKFAMRAGLLDPETWSR